ncbi:MAG TPA: hypothetical protein VMB50_18035 [Myxococcales bacterium]|nr:hypothetical protein [Myxococcales bacterium]
MRRLAALLFLVACGTPPAPLSYPTDEAIGPFALDPSSPVIARSTNPSDPDYGGATAPSVWHDARGYHAVYLGLDANGNGSLLGADSLNGFDWIKRAAPLLGTTPGLGRPAALGLSDGGVALYHAQLGADGGSDVVGPSGAVVIPGGDQPCATVAAGVTWLFALMPDGAIHGFKSASSRFVDQGVALGPDADAGADGGFDTFAVSAPTAFVETSALDRTLFRLWYVGIDQSGGTPSIGLAGSFGGTGFERYAENPVRYHGDVPAVYQVDGGLAMLYSQTPFDAPTDISLATGP